MSFIFSILQQYPIPAVEHTEYVGGGGGFSGAQLWKVQTAETSYCLRRWPQIHPTRERLDWIHRVLSHAVNQDCPMLAVPLLSMGGQRVVTQPMQQGRGPAGKAGYLWELSPWMPGAADFCDNPNPARLKHVMECLARFHLASAQVSLDFKKSPNAQSRRQALQTVDQTTAQIAACDRDCELASVHQLRELVIGQSSRQTTGLCRSLDQWTDTLFPVQPVIRDIWHDHVLYTHDEVTGIVDFGAMQMDNVALDISRLLGSLVPESPDLWQTALETYSAIRPLGDPEIQFAMALDQSATLLASLNWLKWILIEQRRFESWSDVDRRIQHLVNRWTR